MHNFYDEQPATDFKNNYFDVDTDYNFNVSVASSEVKNLKQEKLTGREKGKYIIINSPDFITYKKDILNYTKNLFYQKFKSFVLDEYQKVLVVGVGNEYIESDCFGPLCVNKLKLKKNIFAIKPNVFENTNILSYDVVNSICKTVKPDLVIVIDSLATRNIKRLTTSFQITDVGLLPGGALNNNNKPISKKTLKIPCVVIGVPSMLFAGGLNDNLEEKYKNIILTPKDVRITLDYCSDIVVDCIDKLF